MPGTGHRPARRQRVGPGNRRVAQLGREPAHLHVRARQTFTISEAAVPIRKTSNGTQQWRPAGAAVWSAPTIEPGLRRIYTSTSNGYTFPAVNSTDAVMALDLDSGKRLWTRQLTPNDAYVNSTGPNTTCVVPSVHGCLRARRTWPSAVTVSRSGVTGGRNA